MLLGSMLKMQVWTLSKSGLNVVFSISSPDQNNHKNRTSLNTPYSLDYKRDEKDYPKHKQSDVIGKKIIQVMSLFTILQCVELTW